MNNELSTIRQACSSRTRRGEKPLSGEVKAVGTEVEGVKVGDKVVFAKYGGTEINLDDKTYLVLNIDDVLGVIK